MLSSDPEFPPAHAVKSHALASFWRCYDQLPDNVQRLARKNFALFQANPRHPSLGFQKKGGVYTVEVGRSYRAIARDRNGESFERPAPQCRY